MLKLVTFNSIKNSIKRPGILQDNNAIIDLSQLINPIVSMNGIIENESTIIPIISNELINKTSKLDVIDHNSYTLYAPIPLPKRNVMCIGKNYLDHINEIKNNLIDNNKENKPIEIPQYPQFFTKAPNSVIGLNDYIESHSKLTSWLDYEAELAVVIGKQGRDITAENAEEFIFGYTIANDITARDVQRRHNQWFKGKTLDRTCPLGPYILHKSSLPLAQAQNLEISTHLNGNRMQHSNTNKMIFTIDKIIYYLSQGFTLYPGDVILTGTPDGVGYARNPPVTMKAGDVVEISIEKLGKLTNNVIE